MRAAANKLIGEHDFRNLCKMDKDKTTIRRVFQVEIVAPREETSMDICTFVIVGQSFVWHQIRCIVAVLLLVGKGCEEPEIMSELLDVMKNPRLVVSNITIREYNFQN